MSRQDEDGMVLTKTPENNVFYIWHGKVLLGPNVIRNVRQPLALVLLAAIMKEPNNFSLTGYWQPSADLPDSSHPR